ncbi:hypothetical protein AVEN_73634-1, partial [Araneus ventricosus]
MERSIALRIFEAIHWTLVTNFFSWGRELLFPDLSTCEYSLIQRRNKPQRSIHYLTVPDILETIDSSIQTIKRSRTASGLLQLPQRWKRVLHSAGNEIYTALET